MLSWRAFVCDVGECQSQALEVDAYSSVHDMIHAAIVAHGPRATLREVTFRSSASTAHKQFLSLASAITFGNQVQARG